jgi:uncharacterized protein YcfL
MSNYHNKSVHDMKKLVLLFGAVILLVSCAELFREITIIDFDRSLSFINDSADSVSFDFFDSKPDSVPYSRTYLLGDMSFLPAGIRIAPHETSAVDATMKRLWYEYQVDNAIDTFRYVNETYRRIGVNVKTKGNDTTMTIAWKSTGWKIVDNKVDTNSRAAYRLITCADTFKVSSLIHAP